MQEIGRMRKEQMSSSQYLHAANALSGSNLISELKALRQRKHDLERHMNNLQDSRKQLMDVSFSFLLTVNSFPIAYSVLVFDDTRQ